MPISADPNDLIPFVFKTDQKKENPPTAYIKFRTGREDKIIRKLARAIGDAIEKHPDDEDALVERFSDLYKFGIARLENYPPDWTIENLAERLSGSEWVELENAVVGLPWLTEDERKNSVSPSTSEDAAAVTEPTTSTGS